MIPQKESAEQAVLVYVNGTDLPDEVYEEQLFLNATNRVSIAFS